MICSELQEVLSAYANGELARTQHEFVEEHLSVCSECQKLLADYAEVRRQLVSLGAIYVTSDIKHATMSKIGKQAAYDGQPRKSRTSRLKSRLAEEFRPLIAFISRQPKWKIATVGIVVLALSAVLSIAILSLNGKSDVVLAEKIARNSATFILASDGEGQMSVAKRQKLEDGNIDIVFTSELGQQIAVQVALNEKIVTKIALLGYELSETEKTEAIDIAKANTKVKELMDNGAYIKSVYRISSDNNGVIANVVLMQENQEQDRREGQLIRVDLEKKEVQAIIEKTAIPMIIVFPNVVVFPQQLFPSLDGTLYPTQVLPDRAQP